MSLCTMCERPAPNVFDVDDPSIIQPSGGVHLIMYAGYGMFIDMPEYATHQQQIHIRLCHDCSYALVEMFPEKFKVMFKVSHSKEVCLVNSPMAKHPSSNGGCKYSY